MSGEIKISQLQPLAGPAADTADYFPLVEAGQENQPNQPKRATVAQVLQPLQTSLAAADGASKIGYGTTTVKAELDNIYILQHRQIDPFELLSPAEKNDVANRIGLIDVSAKFQQALDMAGYITPSKGKYRIESTLIVRGNTRLEGTAPWFFDTPQGIPQVQLYYPTATGQCLVSDASFNRMTIKYLKLTGPGRTVPGRTNPATFGANIYASAFCEVSQNYIEGFDAGLYIGRCTQSEFRGNIISSVNYGLRTQTAGPTFYNTMLDITNNYVSDADAYGYYFDNTGRGSKLFNNSADACLGWGMYLGQNTKSLNVISYYTELCQAGALDLYQCDGINFGTLYLGGPPPGSFPAFRNLRVNNINNVDIRDAMFEDIGGTYHLETIGTNYWGMEFTVGGTGIFRAAYSGGDHFRFFRQNGKRSTYEGDGLITKAGGHFSWNGTTLSLEQSHYITSVVRSGTGVYVVTMSRAMEFSTYMVIVTLDSNSITQPGWRVESRSTTSFTIKTFSAGAAADPQGVSFVVQEVGNS